MTTTSPQQGDRQRYIPISVIVAAAVALLGWLAFGFFGVHTLFTDRQVDEAAPFFVAGDGASGLPSDAISAELADAMTQAMLEDGIPAIVEAGDSPPTSSQGEVLTILEGAFTDRSHPGEGQALVITDGSERRVLRFEDFRTDNGPDLVVWLTSAPQDAPGSDLADDFIPLGELKGNVGDQNYEIQPDVDLDRYQTVVIWCRRFSVAFAAATMS